MCPNYSVTRVCTISEVPIEGQDDTAHFGFCTLQESAVKTVIEKAEEDGMHSPRCFPNDCLRLLNTMMNGTGWLPAITPLCFFVQKSLIREK